MAPAEDSTDPVLKEVLRQDRKRPRPWIANVKDYKDSLPEDLDQVGSCLPGSKAPQTLLSDPLSASRQATELPTPPAASSGRRAEQGALGLCLFCLLSGSLKLSAACFPLLILDHCAADLAGSTRCRS